MGREKPREKLLKKGASALREDELLALIIGTGTAAKSALSLAAEVALLLPASKDRTRIEDLTSIPGIKAGKASVLLAALELGKRWYSKPSETIPSIDSLADAVRAVSFIREKKKEYFIAVYLNARNNILATETVSIGTLNASLVHPREVFEPAVRHLATSVLLAHNHPSGDPEPSDADIAMTKRLGEAGRIMGIELLDHLIVTTERYYSFREKMRL